MQIIRGTEPIPVDHPVFLIFGQPGIGKSTLGYSAGDPLLLDFDAGAHRAANRRDTLKIGNWSDVAELMSHPTALDPYKTISTDTIGRCLDTITAAIALDQPKMAPNGNLSQQGWGTLRNRFKQWVGTMRALGKDVILIAHDKEDKDGDTRIVRPDIQGGSYGEVMKTCDFCGYFYMSGKQRILDFNPTDRWIGKNPGGWDPFIVPPVEQAHDFMAKLLDRGRAALGQISAASAESAKAVDTWRETIMAYRSVADFNGAIVKTNELERSLQPQVKKILLDVAVAAGLEFSRTLHCFIDPKATTNATAAAAAIEPTELPPAATRKARATAGR